MNLRIFDIKTRFAFLVSLMLGLAAAGPALAQSVAAQCKVTLSTILPGNHAVLKADCGSASMNSITWSKDGIALPGFPVTFTATLADLNFTTLLTSGTHSYTASGTATSLGNNPISTAVAAVITLSEPILTVAGSNGGTVTSAPGGINCFNGDGTCTAAYASGTVVTLTAAPDSTHSFSGWGGDCSGTNCVVSMTTARTVSAAFGAQPIPGVCATPGPSSSPPTDLCTTGTPSSISTANNTYSWTCAGPNNGSTASCSAPQIVAGACGTANGGAPVSTTPTGTAACNPGTATNMNPGATQFTWTCAGFNGGGSSPQCAVNIAATPGACGGANGTYLAIAPTGTEACLTGTIGSSTVVSNQFSWSCNGLAGGSPASCTAFKIVNGACGAANGGSFTSAPSAELCSAGTASGVAGTSSFSWTCTGSNTGTTASCGASLSTTGTASCAVNQVFGASDLEWPIEGALFPVSQPGLQASGDFGTAIRFTSDVVTYPLGILIHVVDQAAQPSDKEFVVSSCPHNFIPTQATCGTASGATGTLVLRFGQGSVTALNGDCPLEPNQTYYLNVRPWTAPRGSVYTQIWWNRRTDP